MSQRHNNKTLGLTAETILDLWDRGSQLGAGERALLILAAAEPEQPIEALAGFKASERDATILNVRTHTLGPVITAVSHCPECGESIELNFSAEQIGLSPTAAPSAAQTETVQCLGHDVTLKPVTAGDLAEVDGLLTVDAVREQLLRRTVLAIDGMTTPMIEWELISSIEAALEELDPLAAIDVALSCPACQYQWAIAFDAARFFWEEIQTVALTLLWEVAELARTFHWSQAEILSMSARRRRFYLEMT
jgi:hypothetical protein